MRELSGGGVMVGNASCANALILAVSQSNYRLAQDVR